MARGSYHTSLLTTGVNAKTTKTKRMPATAQLQNLFSQNPEMLKDIVKEALEEILEKEMSEALGAERAERTQSRLGYRSGHYTRGLVTRIGKPELRVPRDRLSTELFITVSAFREGAGCVTEEVRASQAR